MGQKVHPVGFRIGIKKNWTSKWMSGKDYSCLLHEDLKIKQFIKNRLPHAGVSRIEIERTTPKKVKITIHAARPGIVIGRKGTEIDLLRSELEEMVKRDCFIAVQEIQNPELDARLVAENVALQLERRISFRRAVKRAVATSMRLGAKGIKIACAGRLAGAEIARREWYREGRIPLHTLRADIDYGIAESNTTYGKIGVKVWVCLDEGRPTSKTPPPPAQAKEEKAKDVTDAKEG